MILVTVGTSDTPFDRLIAAVDRVPGEEEILVQCGASACRPARATCVAYLAFEELAAVVRRARIVVTHVGAGSIILALSNGMRPIVVPRMARHGEAVDDHQCYFGRRLAEDGLVTFLNDPAKLPEALSSTDDEEFEGTSGASRILVEELRGLIRRSLADGAPPFEAATLERFRDAK